MRRILALVCIALVACAAVVPGGAAEDVFAVLTPVWLEFQPDATAAVPPVDAAPPAEQPVSLRALAPFRAPPAALSA